MEKETLVGYDYMVDYYADIFMGKSEFDTYLIQLDQPIKYKGLIFYPVPIKLYFFFKTFAECLVLKQYKINDINVLQMKYLDFLFYKNEKLNIDNSFYVQSLEELLLICLRLPRTFKTENNKEFRTIEFIKSNNHYLIKIYNETYDYKDFERIRKIICEQNLIELPDNTISPDIEKKYEEYIEHLRKIGKIKTGDLEDLSLCIMSEVGYTKEETMNLSIRTFYKLLERIAFIMEYKINNMLAPYLKDGAMDKLPNWTDKIVKKNKMEEMSSSLQDTINKISGAQ